MTSRANRRRGRARARRRDDARLAGLLTRARRDVRDLARRGSVFDLAREVETEEARAALHGAIGAIVREELLLPLTTDGPRRHAPDADTATPGARAEPDRPHSDGDSR